MVGIYALLLLTNNFLLHCQAQGNPSFSQPTYTAFIQENVAVGTVVDMNIQATVNGGSLTYSLESETTDFKIDSSNAVLSTTHEIDYESQPQYNFSVLATDLTGQTSDSAHVVISIIDENEPPAFDRSAYDFAVAEGADLGTAIGNLTATDEDGGELAGQISSYSIIGGDEDRVFALEPDGRLCVAGVLDRETNASYTLTVQATDGGDPSLDTTAVVTVSVEDMNDNAPTFTQSFYTATLSSTDSLREWSTTVVATDVDIDANAEITYSITEGNEAGIFNIDSSNGEITIADSLDALVAETFTLTVVAVDGGAVALNDTVTVTINVNASAVAIEEQATTTVDVPITSIAATPHTRQLLCLFLPSLLLLVSLAALCT